MHLSSRISGFTGSILRALASAILVSGAALPALAQSAGGVRTEANTGLFTLAHGHAAFVYLVDVGPPTALPTRVTLELLDAAGNPLRRTHGTLLPSQPLRLTFTGSPSGPAIAVRARAVLSTSVENEDSAPILTFEVFNQQTFDSFANASCKVKFDPEGTGGKVLGDCGGCHISTTFDR